MKKGSPIIDKNKLKPGFKIGKWTLIEPTKNKFGQESWVCKCECGNTATVVAYNLWNGYSGKCSTCGRLESGHKARRHGECGTTLYSHWRTMRNRCNKTGGNTGRNYKEKGITVCAEWDVYENFRDWAVANGYKDELSIDRIDNSKGYSPDNCRWIPLSEQGMNKTTNRLIECDGEVHPLAMWAKMYGMAPATLRGRLDRGWDIKDAISTDIQKWRHTSKDPVTGRFVTINKEGERCSLS